MSGAQVAAQVSTYGALLILAHLVPPRAFGTVAFGTALLYIGVVLMDSGTRGTIIVAPVITSRFLQLSLVRCLGVGLGLSAVIAVGSHALSQAFTGGASAGIIAALGLGIPAYALAIVPMGLLQRGMHFRSLAAATATANVGSAVLAVVAGWLGAGVWALVARQLCWCSLLAVLSARALARQPTNRGSAPARRENPLARWFLLFAVTQVLTFNLDYLVIGHQLAAEQLGLYSVAFMIAFAPLQYFSAAVGQVLFAAAAASGASASAARTLIATRLMALILLPAIPVVVVLAPLVLPAVLGARWSGLVVPFELLVVAGIGYSIVNCVAEALSGIGEMPFRAKFNVVWCSVTLAALVVLVRLDGIRGAALAHLVVFVGYAAVFAASGMRRLGSDGRKLGRAVRPVLVALAAQALVTSAVYVALQAADAGRWVSSSTAAAVGVACMAAAAAHGERAPLREAVTLLRDARRSPA